MHLDRAVFAPVILIVMIAIPLFIARRRIRKLEAEEKRLLEEGARFAQSVAVEGGHEQLKRNEPLPDAARQTVEYQLGQQALEQTRPQLREVRADLTLLRKVNLRGLWLLAFSFAFLFIMLLL